jgi:hypothetical protein
MQPEFGHFVSALWAGAVAWLVHLSHGLGVYGPPWEILIGGVPG